VDDFQSAPDPFSKAAQLLESALILLQIEPFQERLGGRIALLAEIDVPGVSMVSYNLHLESREWLAHNQGNMSAQPSTIYVPPRVCEQPPRARDAAAQIQLLSC
jgi:hypothetical protein